MLDRTAAIFEQAGRPELAAAEVGRLLDDLDCCARWAVVHETGASRFVVEASGPMTPADLRDLLNDPAVFCIDLFDRGGHHFSIVAEPRPSIAATESFAAVLRLARHYASAQAGLPPMADAEPGAAAAVAMTGMGAVLHIARRVADSDVPVLLLGETGVGKEWLARRIHEWSRRERSRFVGFNCAAVSREMVEAQLFGHRKGAFTGAIDGSVGVIRGADGGTVLLDEIGDVPADCQAKLLRFLETGEVHGIGEVLPSPDQRARAGRDQSSARGSHRHRPDAPRPLLPAQRGPHRDPAASPAARRDSSAGRRSAAQVRQGVAEGTVAAVRGLSGSAGGLRLAGQRATARQRTAEGRRAGLRRRHHRAARPVARDRR